MSEIVGCADKSCNNRASMGIKSRPRKNFGVVTEVFYDERAMPKSAVPYCAKHGRELLGGLVVTLLPPDEDMRVARGRVRAVGGVPQDGTVLPGLTGRSQADVPIAVVPAVAQLDADQLRAINELPRGLDDI